MIFVKYFSHIYRYTGRCIISSNIFKMSSVRMSFSNEPKDCQVEEKESSKNGEESSNEVIRAEANGNCGPKNDVNVDKLIRIDKTPYTIVNEGEAEVLFPSSHDVFYNPVQEFNRDLSVAVMKQFVKMIPLMDGVYDRKFKKKTNGENTFDEIHVLEALAASGLRSIRYAKEVPGITKVVANDMSSQAYESIQRNITYNNVEHLVTPSNEEATMLMYQHRSSRKRFEVVDLDPYGTASPFFDAAVQSVSEGGLLMVTCTDMAVLCGNTPETCHAKYGAVSLKSGYCHEMALRILLQSIETHANRYGRYIEPILSLSADFYARVFVRIFSGAALVKKSFCKLGMVYDCNGCGSYHVQPLGKCVETLNGQKYVPHPGPPVDTNCKICGERHKVSIVVSTLGTKRCGLIIHKPDGHRLVWNKSKVPPGPTSKGNNPRIHVDVHGNVNTGVVVSTWYQIGGPIWISGLHNKEFIRQITSQVGEEHGKYKTSRRILGVLNVILEELDDCPLFYRVDKLCSVVHTNTPSALQYRSAILHAGYRVSLSHVLPTSMKTDAPPAVIWDIIRTWAKLHPGKKSFELEPSKTILSKECSTKVSFELHPDANPESRAKSLLRFQINPQPYWGPKCRATTSLWAEKTEEKRKKCQSKRKRSKKNEEMDLKQFPCKKFRQNECDKGDECRYSHEIERET